MVSDGSSLSVPLARVVSVSLVDWDFSDPHFELDDLPELRSRRLLVGPHEHRYLPIAVGINFIGSVSDPDPT